VAPGLPISNAVGSALSNYLKSHTHVSQLMAYECYCIQGNLITFYVTACDIISREDTCKW